MDDYRLQVARGQLCRPATDLGVAEAVVGLGGLEVVHTAAKDEPVGGLGAAQRPHAEFTAPEAPAVADGDLGPGLPWIVKRSQPTRFCPKSTSVRPDGDD